MKNNKKLTKEFYKAFLEEYPRIKEAVQNQEFLSRQTMRQMWNEQATKKGKLVITPWQIDELNEKETEVMK